MGEQHSQVVGRQRKVHRAAGPLILVLIFRGRRKLISISRIKEGEGGEEKEETEEGVGEQQQQEQLAEFFNRRGGRRKGGGHF